MAKEARFPLKDRPWLRLYTVIANQYKIQRLPGETFKFWINCLCLAARANGYLPSIDDIGFHLRLPAAKVIQMLTALNDPKHPLIDEIEPGLLKIHDWDQWQYETDNSTDRVKEYRQRVKDAGRVVNAYSKHRKAIFARDENRCVYCGSGDNLCLDHVVPIILGGDDEQDNLATACKGCNSGKSGRTPEQAGMTIRADCNYVTVYATNLSRLHGFIERRKEPRVTVTCNQSDSVSVSVSESVSESEIKKETSLREPVKISLLDDFGIYQETAADAKLEGSEDDWKTAKFEWSRLDFEKKTLAIKGLRERVASGDYSDPAFRPLVHNYLKKKMWQRPIRASPVNSSDRRLEEMLKKSREMGI